jgi:hypothetical protein
MKTTLSVFLHTNSSLLFSFWGKQVCCRWGSVERLDGLALEALYFSDGEAHATPESGGNDFTLRTPPAKCDLVQVPTAAKLLWC